MSPSLPLLGGRAFEILCAAVVLGLSASLYPQIDTAVKVCDATNTHCGLGGVLPSVGYCAFVGAWGLLDALLGVVMQFVTAIPFFVLSFFDGFAIVAFLAGGIRLAVLLADARGCNGNDICDKLKADAAFCFLGFLAAAVLLVFVFVQQRRGGAKGGAFV